MYRLLHAVEAKVDGMHRHIHHTFHRFAPIELVFVVCVKIQSMFHIKMKGNEFDVN